VNVLVGCHALIYIDEELAGETMERVVMERLDWTLSKGDTSSEKGGRRRRIQVSLRYPNHVYMHLYIHLCIYMYIYVCKYL
jgi:hypothetical protein